MVRSRDDRSRDALDAGDIDERINPGVDIRAADVEALPFDNNSFDWVLSIEVLQHEVSREERMQSFVREALAADAEIEAGAAVYRAEDVHDWLDRLATKRKAAPPKPWQK